MKPQYEYLSSLPERATRAGAALLGGFVNETTSVLLPIGLRRTRLYQATVARLLRITIELVGDVKGVFPDDPIAARALLVRKTAGNVVELASFLAVGWSPLWLLAAASDLMGGTRVYLQALATELKQAGALPTNVDVASFEELLGAIEGTSGVLADTIDIPPLNTGDARGSLDALRQHAGELPSRERLALLFAHLQEAARAEGRTLLEVSSVVALGAARAGVQIGNIYLFEYYRSALQTIAEEGMLAYLGRASAPYLRRAAAHFDAAAPTYTERLLRRWADRKGERGRGGDTRQQTRDMR